MQQSRRGFLSLLGVGLIAGPSIVRAGSLMPVKAVLIEPVRHLIFQDGDLLYNGIIIRYRNEVAKDFIRRNLFPPYSAVRIAA